MCSLGVGHFTQIANNKAGKVGCAVTQWTDSNANTYLVCNYAITNVDAQPIYTVGSPCSGCKTGKSTKYSGLCSPSEVTVLKPLPVGMSSSPTVSVHQSQSQSVVYGGSAPVTTTTAQQIYQINGVNYYLNSAGTQYIPVATVAQPTVQSSRKYTKYANGVSHFTQTGNLNGISFRQSQSQSYGPQTQTFTTNSGNTIFGNGYQNTYNQLQNDGGLSSNSDSSETQNNYQTFSF